VVPSPSAATPTPSLSVESPQLPCPTLELSLLHGRHESAPPPPVPPAPSSVAGSAESASSHRCPPPHRRVTRRAEASQVGRLSSPTQVHPRLDQCLPAALEVGSRLHTIGSASPASGRRVTSCRVLYLRRDHVVGCRLCHQELVLVAPALFVVGDAPLGCATAHGCHRHVVCPPPPVGRSMSLSELCYAYPA
jgi:hypothetical protein